MSEKHNIIRCDVSNSICSMMSNVTSFAKSFIMNYFPDNYFKDIYITTSLVSNQLADNDDSKEIPIKNFPELSITPKYNQNFDEVMGGPFPMWRRGFYEGFHSRNTRYGYKQIFFNDEDKLVLSAIPNRIKFTFDYKIKLQTHLQKIDVCHMLRQKLHENDVFYYNHVLMQTQIPNVIIQAISNIKDFDLTENSEVEELKKYLSLYSVGHIEDRIYTGSGNRTFVYTYAPNILIKVNNPPETNGDNVDKNNMIESFGIVDFSLDMELWIPNNYMFECENLPSGNYAPLHEESKIYIDTYVKLQPNKIRGERTLINWNKFITEINVKVDKIDIESLFDKKVAEFIKENAKEKNYDLLNELFEIVIYRDDKEISKEDFKVNWNKISLELSNPYFNYIYYVGIYANQDLMFKYFVNKK